MEQRTKKIGIMGGTFDPIHMGHLILAEQAYEQLSLDSVIFIPSHNPPHKQDRKGRATDEQRVRMTELAIRDNPHFGLSLVEMEAKGLSYTYITLEKLKARNPDTEYYFIIGADSLFYFHLWMEPGRIAKACTLAVGTRDNASREQLRAAAQGIHETFGANVAYLDIATVDISSSRVREDISRGKSIRYYVPDEVWHYINDNGIYR